MRSYGRGFITVYMAWFLGVDVEDGFWTTYFKPLERLWTENRARKDISLMRGEGLVMEDRLRFTEEGWRCMEEAIDTSCTYQRTTMNCGSTYTTTG